MTEQNEQQQEEGEYEVGLPASKLREHVQKLIQVKQTARGDMFNGFEEEFRYLNYKTDTQQIFGDYKSAMLGVNRVKNRFSNVLPPESTRVVLKTIEGEEGSDYINANFVSGYIPGSEKAYIATQGPLRETFQDFWRMVWEQNSTVVVMLTKEVEDGRHKCDRYWPEGDEAILTDLFKVTVSDSEERVNRELIERKLILHNLKTNETRPILHLQYVAWPDHGLPTSTTAFLSLLDDADRFDYTGAPIVVHCSAGIGRSGTFCTVHATIEKLLWDLKQHPDVEPKISAAKAVLNARAQRPGMVQTAEQYTFVYLAILEKTEEILKEKVKTKK
jgi:protein tyrosine phosphatase